MSSVKNLSLKRHCMIVLNYYPRGEVRVMREAEVLMRNGYEVDVICLRLPGEPAEETYNNVRLYRLPLQRYEKRIVVVQFIEYILFFLLAFVKVTRLHRERPYESIQVHNLPDFLVFAALIPKLQGVPIILDLHDLMPEFYAARFGSAENNLMIRLVKLQERWSCQFADHVITVTEHWRQSLIKRHLPAKKCTVLMNLADDRIFNCTKQFDVPPLSPGNEERFGLIYHGALFERYGLDLLIQSVARLRNEIPGIYLSLIGKGPYREALQIMVERMGLQQHIALQPFMLIEGLPSHIVAADLAVVPYRNDVFTQELLPTKLMEYAALGMPVIVSRTMAVEAYFDNKMVKFFKPGDVNDLADRILELYHDRAQLAQLGLNIQKFNQQYNWPKQSETYLNLLDVLKNGRHGVRDDLIAKRL